MGHFAILGEFSWCNDPETVGVVTHPSFYPVAMSYQDMLDRLYKVKEYRLDYSFTYSRDLGEGLFEDGSADGYFLLPSQLEDESEFACDSAFRAFAENEEAGAWTRTDETGGAVLANARLEFLSGQHYQHGPGGVLPHMIFDLSFAGGAGAMPALYMLSSWRNDGGDENDEYEVDFAGMDLKCWKPTADGFVCDLVCTISITDLWNYA